MNSKRYLLDRKLTEHYKVKYAMVAAYVARLSLTTASELPSLTIMFVVPTVLRAYTTRLFVSPSTLKISLWQFSGTGKVEQSVL